MKIKTYKWRKLQRFETINFIYMHLDTVQWLSTEPRYFWGSYPCRDSEHMMSLMFEWISLKKTINALSTSYQLQLTAFCIVFTLISASPSHVRRNTFRIHQTKEQNPFKPTHCAHLQKVHSRSTRLDQRGRGRFQSCLSNMRDVKHAQDRNRDAVYIHLKYRYQNIILNIFCVPLLSHCSGSSIKTKLIYRLILRGYPYAKIIFFTV